MEGRNNCLKKTRQTNKTKKTHKTLTAFCEMFKIVNYLFKSSAFRYVGSTVVR